MNHLPLSTPIDPFDPGTFDDERAEAPRGSRRAALACGAALLMFGAAIAAWQPERATPVEVVDAYMQALVASFEDDEAQYLLLRTQQYVCEESRAALEERFDEFGFAGMDTKAYWLLNQTAYALDYEILESSNEGDSASVTARLHGTASLGLVASLRIDFTMTLDLVEELGEWRICDDDVPGV
jgi:hypothetical protein